MLGGGCPWQNQCGACNDRFNQKNYCSSISTWKKCPHRPLNYGDREIERNYGYHRASEGNASLGRWIILIVVIIIIVAYLK